MRRLFVVILLLLSSVGLADETARQQKVALAVENAQRLLYRKIGQSEISPHVSVNQFVQSAGGSTLLEQAVAKAEQIGGPRWVDANTCQVRLEISGLRVAQTLLNIAQNAPRQSPITPTKLQAELSNWKRQTFVATGMSVGIKDMGRLDPAIEQARNDAIARLSGVIGELRLPDASSIKDSPEAREVVKDCLGAAKIEAIELSRDDQWMLALATPADEIVGKLRKLDKKTGDESRWMQFREQLVRSTTDVYGVAARDSRTPSPIDWRKMDEPVWARQVLSASGFAAPGSARLKAVATAQKKATDALRETINKLPATPDVTLEKAAAGDPRVLAVLELSVQKARVVKSEYHPNGAVTVTVELDAQVLWQSLKD